MKNRKVILGLSALLCLSAVGVAAVAGNGLVTGTSAVACTHSDVKYYEGVAPTAETTGKMAHYACCECHKRWTDAAHTNEVTDDSLIIAKKTEAVATNPNAGDDTAIVYTASDKVKEIDQTDWDNTTTGKGAGTFNYYTVDGHTAMYVSALGLTSDQQTLRDNNNSGFSEWRFKKTVSALKTVTFSYKYWDLNTENAANVNCHALMQQYDGKDYYNGPALNLVGDNQWHDMTVTFDAAHDVTYTTMKIYHFYGEIYISDLVIGETPAAPDLSNSAYGIKMMNGEYDVSNWDGTHSQATRLVATSDSISTEGYGFNFMSIYLPKVNYRKTQAMSFRYSMPKTVMPEASDTCGNTFVKLGDNQVELAYDTDFYGTLNIGASATHAKGEVWAELSGWTYSSIISYQITDEDVINGLKPFVFQYAVNCMNNAYRTVTLSNPSMTYAYASDANALLRAGFSISDSGHLANWQHNGQRDLYYYGASSADVNCTISLPFVSSEYNRVKSVETWMVASANENTIGFAGETQGAIGTGDVTRFIVEKTDAGYNVTISVYALGKSGWNDNVSASDFVGKTPTFTTSKEVTSLENCVTFFARIYRLFGIQLGTVTLAD